MTPWRTVVVLLISVVGVSAQIPKVLVEDGTPETQHMTKVLEATSNSEKAALAESFLKTYPNSEAVLVVLDAMQSANAELKNYDKVMAAAKEILAALPGHVASGIAGLRAAQAKKDGKLILEWAVRASEAARKAESAQRPEPTETKAELQERKESAKEVQQYAEYSVFALTREPAYAKERSAIAAVMQQQWPRSQYLSQINVAPTAIRVTPGNSDEAVVVAEKMIKDGQATLDSLLLATSYYFQRRPEKSVQYGQKLIEFANGAAPADTDAAEWQKKRRFALVNAYYMVGVSFSEQEKFALADRYLRQGIEMLRGDASRLATALYHLGIVNYKLAEGTKDKARINDAIRFTEQCASMKSPFQAAAAKNLDAFKAEFNIP